MKRTKTIYWITTILFAGFMAMSAIPDVLMQKEAMDFITQLGYPDYFVPFIGVAKLLGCIALVVPGFPKTREWAYAGLAFDLIGAVYSNLMVHGWDNGMLTLIPVFGVMIASYIYNQK